jgi:hypothetical protein
MSEGVSAVGSRVSGNDRGEPLPTPDNEQPTTDNVRWRLLYAAVITELAILILIFYAFTKAFA